MSEPLRVLIVEDSEEEALLMLLQLQRGGYEPAYERVDTPESMDAALRREAWDIVLSDFSMPRFSGWAALKLFKEAGLNIPFIMVSGKIGEDTAIDAMKAGAHDYIMKDNLQRLIPSVKRELREAESRRQRYKAEQALRQSESRFSTVFHHSPMPMAITLLSEGRFLDVNNEYLRLTGYSREEVIGRTTIELNLWVDPDDRGMFLHDILQHNGSIKGRPVSVRTKPGDIVDLLFSADVIDTDNTSCLLSSAVDITELRTSEKRQKLAGEILEVLNETTGLEDVLRDILDLIKKEFGIGAVGIRLREGKDYPYCSTNGFPRHFVEMERALCAQDSQGVAIHDPQGNPILECMCGAVILGRTDPSQPFFTEYGSFWTNSTTKLLTTTSEIDHQSRARNTCNKEGYESVALVPLRAGEEIIGLLQLNDRCPDRFTLEMIHFFEGLGGSIGIAFDRRKKMDLLREAEEKYRSLASTTDSMYLVDRESRYLFMNEKYSQRFGIPVNQVLGRRYGEFHAEEDAAIFDDTVKHVFETGEASTIEFKSTRDGKDFLRTFSPVKDAGGNISAVTIVSKDITERKKAETLLRESEELFRGLFENSLSAVAIHELVQDEQGNPCDYIFLKANSAFEKHTGLCAADVLGKRVTQIHPGIEKTNLIDVYGKVALTGTPFFFETFFEPAQRYYNISAYPVAKGCFATIFEDITERVKTDAELQHSRGLLRALAGRLQAIREEERKMIAREIHDELGGALTSLKIDLSLLTKAAHQLKDKQTRTNLLDKTDSIMNVIDTSIQTVRRIAAQLRPGILDDLGLVETVEWQLQDYQKRTGLQCSFLPEVKHLELDEQHSTALFRIFQEAMTNVVRHAGATGILVRLSEQPGELVMEIEDNGRGIRDEEIRHSSSLGILGMKERALLFGGDVVIKGQAGVGTRVTVKIPR